jgi:hypothetical protein
MLTYLLLYSSVSQPEFRDMSQGVLREIVIEKKINIVFFKFARRAMLPLAMMDSDRATPLAISLEVFQPPFGSAHRTLFIWLSPFSVFEAREERPLIIGERCIARRGGR